MMVFEDVKHCIFEEKAPIFEMVLLPLIKLPCKAPAINRNFY
jgi:hypothetical protein